MARPTLASLIQYVRDLTMAGTAEFTVGASTYFSDNHIQDNLDRHRVDVYQELLTPYPETRAGGSIHWLEYRSRYRFLESSDGGTAVCVVEDATGADQGTANWSADYQRGVVTFGTTTGGSAYYLTGRAYDVYGAAAELLRSWAAREKLSFDFSVDNQNFKRSQKAAVLRGLAEEYEAKAWPVVIEMIRRDV